MNAYKHVVITFFHFIWRTPSHTPLLILPHPSPLSHSQISSLSPPILHSLIPLLLVLPSQAELFAQAAARFKNQAAALSAMGSSKQPSEEEASEANNRNRAISSSAISRAMADANAGR